MTPLDPPSASEFAPEDDPSRRPPDEPAADAPDGSALDAHLLELRARLKQAREERGGCPPWSEVRADLVPGGGQREGREQRQAHVAICPYCSTHVTEWRTSDEFNADRLEALERGVARGIAGGAMGLIRSIGLSLPSREAGEEPRLGKKPRPERKPKPRKQALSAREERDLAEAAAAGTTAAGSPAPPHPMSMSPVYQPPPQVMYVPPESRPGASPESALCGRLLVVEMADGRTPPESVFLCARALDAEVALVESIDEMVGDPDLSLVLGVVLGGSRPPETWPDVVRHARSIVRGRPVLLLASFGSETTPGARRALGGALLSEADPPERLLLALDPDLR